MADFIYDQEFNVPINDNRNNSNQTTKWRTGIINGAVYYFTFQYNGEQKIAFIKNPQGFEGMFVVLGSTPRRNNIMTRINGRPVVVHAFLCADCRMKESDCGPHSMYNIVYNGQPKIVCSNCLNKYNTQLGKYSSDYQTSFYHQLCNESYATIRTVNSNGANGEFAENFIPSQVNFYYENIII